MLGPRKVGAGARTSFLKFKKLEDGEGLEMSFWGEEKYKFQLNSIKIPSVPNV